MSITREQIENAIANVVREMDSIEKAYWNHEVARYLDIGESTLRKWCIELEKNGYIFIKGAKDSRAFTEHDLNALNHFKQMLKNKKHTMKQAALVVIEKYGDRKGENVRTTPDMPENNRSIENLENMIKQLIESHEEQKEFNKALLEKLDQQNRYIKESLDKRDQLLLKSLRESQDEKAAAIEKEKEESEKKKNKFRRLIEIFKT